MAPFLRNFLWNKISVCHDDNPLFFTDFDRVIEYAKTSTKEKIEEYQEKMKIDYKEYIEKLKLDIQKRNKTFIS